MKMSKKKKNIPELRFPEFSDEWRIVVYGEVFSFKVTNSLSRECLNYQEGKVKNIHYGDIHKRFTTLFDVNKETVPYINKRIDVSKIDTENYCQMGDVIHVDASEDSDDVGKCIEVVNTNNEKILAGLHTILARPKRKTFASGFCAFLMNSEFVRLQIRKLAQGTKVYSISMRVLNNIVLPFPSLPEQQKIANFLTSVDERLQTLKKKKSFLEQYKKGVMQKIFSQEIRFKDEKGKNFPKWQSKKLGEVGKFYAGGDLSKLKYSKMKDEKFVYPIYANGAGEGIYGYATTYQFNASCVTVSGRGNLGYAKVRTQKFNAIVRLIVIEPNKEINPKFLEELVNDTNFAVESTGVPQLTVPQISSYVVSFPCVEEQQKIANFLSSIDEKIDHCNKEIEKTESYKKGLLQKMFV